MTTINPKPEQEQDLNWQKEEESDSLQKSEKPDKKYMEDSNLCHRCHGILLPNVPHQCN